MKIGKTSDMTNSWFRGVVYGASGVGKTRSIVTLKNSGFNPILAEVVPWEDGALSISDIPLDHVRIATVTEKELTPEMKDRGYCSLQELLTTAEKLPNDVIYIEGLTSISKLYLNKAKKESTNVWEQYGKLAEEMTAMLLKLKSISKNIIFTAHQDTIKTPADLEIYSPLVDGLSFPRQLPGLIDALLYLHANVKGERSLITRYDSKRVCKLRYPGSVNIDLEIPADLGALLIKLGFKPTKKEN